MPKAAKKSKRVARRPRAQSATTNCPVEKLAIEIGELFDAFTGAELEGNKPVARAIEEHRQALEELASFQRARSLGGALFQLVLAQHEIEGIFSLLTAEKQKDHADLDEKCERLLTSAATVIRLALGSDFAPLQNIMRVYGVTPDAPPIPWLDDIPQLAEEGRKADREPKVAADAQN